MVAPVGPPATIRCEPRQTRKGAAAATDSGAGERWAGVAIIPSVIITGNYLGLTKSDRIYLPEDLLNQRTYESSDLLLGELS